MKNLFDTDTYYEITQRLGNLSPQAQRIWGKMDVSQILAHPVEPIKLPLSKERIPGVFLGAY